MADSEAVPFSAYEGILSALAGPDGPVITCGQAVNFWADRFCADEPRLEQFQPFYEQRLGYPWRYGRCREAGEGDGVRNPASAATRCHSSGNIPAARIRIGIVLLGSLIVGAVGFLAGFVGPIIFAPGSNQGPLLGIFITGPLGLFLGAVIGWIIGHFCAHRRIPDL